jgi:hypothetical protein
MRWMYEVVQYSSKVRFLLAIVVLYRGADRFPTEQKKATTGSATAGGRRGYGRPSQEHICMCLISLPMGDKGHWAVQRGCHQVMGVRALSYYLQGQTNHMVKLWDPMVLPAAPAGVNIGPRVTAASPPRV